MSCPTCPEHLEAIRAQNRLIDLIALRLERIDNRLMRLEEWARPEELYDPAPPDDRTPEEIIHGRARG